MPSRHVVRPALLAAACLFAALSATPAPAGAQFLKKLKDAAASKAAEKLGDKAAGKVAEKAGFETTSGPDQVALLGAPLTADTLDMTIKGLAVLAASADEHDRLSQEQVKWADRAGALRGHPDVQRWNEREALVSRCADAFWSELNDRRQNDMQKKMQSDPVKYQGAAMRFAQEIAPLQAKGDQQAVIRAQMKFFKEVMGVDLVADSAAAKAKCGAVPPKPIQFAQIDSADQRSKSLLTGLRAEESRSAERAAKASGLSEQRFAQARERVLTWLYGAGKRWPDAQLMEGKRGDIEKYRKAL